MQPDALSLTSVQLRAAGNGDREALESLLSRYLPRVRRIVAARVGRHWRELALAEDLVQETLLDAYRAVEGGEIVSEAAFCSWLARCVQNRALDELRRGRAEKRGGGAVQRFTDLETSCLSASVFDGGTATPSECLSAQETEERLERLLAGLDARYREVLSLRCYCGMSHREIAEAMELPSENTANALFLRARKALQRQWESGA